MMSSRSSSLLLPHRQAAPAANAGAPKLPNFLIIGAAKSGTTSVASYLDQHPEVYFSPWKEPNYFALAGRQLPSPGPVPPDVMYKLLYFHSVTEREDYEALFARAGDQPARGEASVRYLYYPEAAPRIQATLPNVRLVAILREPVSRLYSHYCMNLQHQLEPLGLMDAIAAEPERIAAQWGWDWHYVGVSRYAPQVRRYLDLFDREQIKIFLYDDLVAQPLATFHAICRHLGISDAFVPDMSERGKVAHRPRWPGIDRWLHWPSRSRSYLERAVPRRMLRPLYRRISQWNGLPFPKIDPKHRAELAPLFHDDIAELEVLLERPIPWPR